MLSVPHLRRAHFLSSTWLNQTAMCLREDCERISSTVGYHNVHKTIVIGVRQSHRIGFKCCLILYRCLEASGAIAKQQRNSIIKYVRRNDVCLSIPVHVSVVKKKLPFPEVSTTVGVAKPPAPLLRSTETWPAPEVRSYPVVIISSLPSPFTSARLLQARPPPPPGVINRMLKPSTASTKQNGYRI
jgi:hypothetical protein